MQHRILHVLGWYRDHARELLIWSREFIEEFLKRLPLEAKVNCVRPPLDAPVSISIATAFPLIVNVVLYSCGFDYDVNVDR